MTKIAYIQQCDPDGWDLNAKLDWWSGNCKDTAIGLKKLGWTIKGFHAQQLYNLPLTKKTLVKGSIGMVRRALDIIGVKQPQNLDIPESLKPYAERKIWKTTLEKIRQSNDPVFIKPLYCQKAFGGMGLPKPFYNDRRPNLLTEFPNSFPILAQELVEWDGEWRVYVLKKKILGIRYYNDGMYSKRPSKSFVEKLIREFKEQPAAYALDIGTMRNNSYGSYKPALVEVNEGFSLGNYGISKIDYSRMVEARWKEMVGTK